MAGGRVGAITALIAAISAGGGYVTKEKLREIITSECTPPVVKVDKVLGTDGPQTKISFQTATSAVFTLCDPNASRLADRVELKITPGGSR